MQELWWNTKKLFITFDFSPFHNVFDYVEYLTETIDTSDGEAWQTFYH